jgi:hypothetical protein
MIYLIVKKNIFWILIFLSMPEGFNKLKSFIKLNRQLNKDNIQFE